VIQTFLSPVKDGPQRLLWSNLQYADQAFTF